MCHYTFFFIVNFLATVQFPSSSLLWKLTFQTNVVVFPPVSRPELQRAPGPHTAPRFPCDSPWLLCGTALSSQPWRTAAFGGYNRAWIPTTDSHHRPAENGPYEPRAGWWGLMSNGLLTLLPYVNTAIHFKPKVLTIFINGIYVFAHCRMNLGILPSLVETNCQLHVEEGLEIWIVLY